MVLGPLRSPLIFYASAFHREKPTTLRLYGFCFVVLTNLSESSGIDKIVVLCTNFQTNTVYRVFLKKVFHESEEDLLRRQKFGKYIYNNTVVFIFAQK